MSFHPGILNIPPRPHPCPRCRPACEGETSCLSRNRAGGSRAALTSTSRLPRSLFLLLPRSPSPPPRAFAAGPAEPRGRGTLQLQPPAGGCAATAPRCWRRGRPDVPLVAPRGGGQFSPRLAGEDPKQSQIKGAGGTRGSIGIRRCSLSGHRSCPAFQEKQPGTGRAGGGSRPGAAAPASPARLGKVEKVQRLADIQTLL